MIYSVNFNELVGKINHIDVARYLCNIGWNEIITKQETVKIFQYRNDNILYQVELPVSRDLRDYKSAMYRVVECIAQSANINVEQIILELINPLSDILKLRIIEPNIENGSINFEDALMMYDNAKKLLLAAAMDCYKPQILHAGRPQNYIVEFVNSCRFGQTEIGSYIISIICPLLAIENNKMIQLSLFNDEEEGEKSFTRQVINKLISSIILIKNAINAGNLENIIMHNLYTTNNISANFLEALSGINIYRENSTLDISVKYASTVRGNTLPNVDLTINHDYFMPINAFISKTKNKIENEKTYFGRIKTLDAVPDPSIRESGKIIIVFLDDNQNKTTASVELQKEDYNNAIEAHLNGKTVKVVGKISGQSKKRIECSQFEIIN